MSVAVLSREREENDLPLLLPLRDLNKLTKTTRKAVGRKEMKKTAVDKEPNDDKRADDEAAKRETESVKVEAPGPAPDKPTAEDEDEAARIRKENRARRDRERRERIKNKVG